MDIFRSPSPPELLSPDRQSPRFGSPESIALDTPLPSPRPQSPLLASMNSPTSPRASILLPALAPAPAPPSTLTPAVLGFLQAHTETLIERIAGEECPICLEEYTEEICVRIIGIPGCTHRVGKTCLGKMLSNRPGDEKRCPLCRTVWMPVTRFWRTPNVLPTYEFIPAPSRRSRRPIIELDRAAGDNYFNRQVDSFNRFTQDIEAVRSRARETSRHQRQDEQATQRSNRVMDAETSSVTEAARFLSSFAGSRNLSEISAFVEGRDQSRNRLPTRMSSLINPISARLLQVGRGTDTELHEVLQAPPTLNSDLRFLRPHFVPSSARTRTSIPLALQRSEMRHNCIATTSDATGPSTSRPPAVEAPNLYGEMSNGDTNARIRETDLAVRELALRDRGIHLERREAALNERENALNARDRSIVTRRAELDRWEGLVRRQRGEMEALVKRHMEETERMKRE